MNFDRLSKLSNLVTNNLKRKPTILVESNPRQPIRFFGTANDVAVSIDVENWEVPEYLKPFISELAKSDNSNEEKILKVYKKLCEDYTYDDNILSYIKKNDDDTFFLPDPYGRNTRSEWKEKREQHNRRTCFEISRILAKSVNEVLKLSGYSKDYDICILWDEAVTHYLVGLASDDYCILLDLDDFVQIKDLTRMKTGLTLEGIKILEDTSGKFKNTLDFFNNDRSKIAKDHIKNNRELFNEKLAVKTENQNQSKDYGISSDDIEFLQYSIEVLKEYYDLDSAGIYEYFKEIVDTKIGARARKKVWKEYETEPGTGKRYTRCLIVTIDDVPYIADVTQDKTEEIFRKLSEEEMKDIIPFKEMSRNWDDDPYDGR